MELSSFQSKEHGRIRSSLGDKDHRWCIQAARVVGERHRDLGERCQDAYFYHASRDSVALALADGAGSARHAAVGSRLAVNIAGRTAIQAVTQGQPLMSAAQQAVEAARAALEQQPYPLRELACTFLLVLWRPTECVVLQIGDGWIVLIEPECCRAAFRPKRGQYANQTHFLTQGDWREQMQVDAVAQPERLVGLALLSDGLEQAVVDMVAAAPNPTFFLGYAKALQSDDLSPREQKLALLAFLASDRVASTSDDDKTLVMAVRSSSMVVDQVSAETQATPDGRE